MSSKVVVIGGGPAGIMAAGRAGERHKEVVLFERNFKPLMKLMITGKGRCNITNKADIETLIDNVPGNGSFLYSSFYNFSNENIIEFFENRRVLTKTERGQRVFPVSDRAEDVANALLDYAKKNNADIHCDARISNIVTEGSKVKGVILGTKLINCDSVILTTGGLSYPKTGSTGDGFRMVEKLGHTIIPPRPSLVPLNVKGNIMRDLAGLSLKNINALFLNSKGKKIYEEFGEMLFTHFGVSGPVILSGSRHILDYINDGVVLSIDLKPALDEEKLYQRIGRDFEQLSRKMFKNSLDDLLPKKLIPYVIKKTGIDEEKFVNQITRDERRKIVGTLKNFTMEIDSTRPVEEAIVTCGGISVNEIDPYTMESKLIKNLFFAGEIIDVDGYTGGFNLTIAFSTGYLAGSSC